MKIKDIINTLDEFAPLSYQESYDNAGLLTGDASLDCTGAICTLDATEEVILEAKQKGCNLVVAHHPVIFNGLKTITGRNYVEKTMITAIKNDIAIYAIHTNLDNILFGVNGKMADKLNLQNRKILLPKPNTLLKLYVFIPAEHTEKVRKAIFAAGAGNIGNYNEVSFIINGKGTFTPGEGANPFLGKIGEKEEVNEEKVEVIFPSYLQEKVISAMIQAHPYEEVAYDLVPVNNFQHNIGSGILGELEPAMDEKDFLQLVKNQFNLQVIRYTPLLNKQVKKVALCGGAGSFLIKNALSANADFYITSDVKYHEFFDADNKIVIADIGHWESEQFTIDLLYDVLRLKFITFAVLKSEIKTNPVNYFT